MKGKFLDRLKWRARDTRFALCASCLLFWWLMLPADPHHVIYLRSTWGQMSVLFAASLLLWIDRPVPWLAAVALCGLMLYAAALNVAADWEFIALSDKPYLPQNDPDGGRIVTSVRLVWHDFLVSAHAVSIIFYAGSRLLNAITRRRAGLA